MNAILYVVPGCPLCADTRTLLRSHRIEYEERDIANDYASLRRMYKLTRQGLVPTIEYGGQAIVRPSAEELLTLLKRD